MITYAFLGFMIALILMMAVAIIWGRAKDSVQRWSYKLTSDTNRQLRETELKLDSILRGQERIEQTLSDLRSRLISQRTAS